MQLSKTFHFRGILIEIYTKTIRLLTLSISMRDSWWGRRPHQLSRDTNLELIIYLLNSQSKHNN